jgi:hypothetical protein
VELARAETAVGDPEALAHMEEAVASIGEERAASVLHVLPPVRETQERNGGNRHSATGSGHITRDGQTRTFAFTATTAADGTVTGQVQVISCALDTVVHFEIDCLRVVGNVAHMSGITTRSSNPAEAPVGEMRRLVAMDNGEGSHSAPDLISTIPVNPAGETCENSTLVPTAPVEEGNVQVR